MKKSISIKEKIFILLRNLKWMVRRQSKDVSHKGFFKGRNCFGGKGKEIFIPNSPCSIKFGIISELILTKIIIYSAHTGNSPNSHRIIGGTMHKGSVIPLSCEYFW